MSLRPSAMHTYIFIVKSKINNIIPNTKWTELTFNVILGGLKPITVVMKKTLKVLELKPANKIV